MEIFEQLIIDYINKLLYFTGIYTFKLVQILLRKCLVYFIHVKKMFFKSCQYNYGSYIPLKHQLVLFFEKDMYNTRNTLTKYFYI